MIRVVAKFETEFRQIYSRGRWPNRWFHWIMYSIKVYDFALLGWPSKSLRNSWTEPKHFVTCLKSLVYLLLLLVLRTDVTCGKGTCIPDPITGFYCLCPLNTTGSSCSVPQTVTGSPYFDGKRSFLSVKRPDMRSNYEVTMPKEGITSYTNER